VAAPTPGASADAPLVNVPALFGKSPREIERRLNTRLISRATFEPGTHLSVPEGGEDKNYTLPNGVGLSVEYDKKGRARWVTVDPVGDSISDTFGYGLDDWRPLFARLGMGDVTQPPDVVAPAGRRWDTAPGYGKIHVTGSPEGGISLVEVHAP